MKIKTFFKTIFLFSFLLLLVFILRKTTLAIFCGNGYPGPEFKQIGYCYRIKCGNCWGGVNSPRLCNQTVYSCHRYTSGYSYCGESRIVGTSTVCDRHLELNIQNFCGPCGPMKIKISPFPTPPMESPISLKTVGPIINPLNNLSSQVKNYIPK